MTATSLTESMIRIGIGFYPAQTGRMEIWGRRNSFNVQKVLWLADEIGLTYSHVAAGGKHGRLNEPEFAKLNPHRKIPVLADNGTVVWESHAVLRYLAAKYGGEKLWPALPEHRSRVDGWMDWAQTTLQPDFLNGVFWGYYRTPEPQRNWPAIRESLSRCSNHYRLLDDVLRSQTFLLGDELSLADIPIATSLYRYFELEIERPDTPHVRRYYDAMIERPAYRQHVMVPFDDLRGRLTF